MNELLLQLGGTQNSQKKESQLISLETREDRT